MEPFALNILPSSYPKTFRTIVTIEMLICFAVEWFTFERLNHPTGKPSHRVSRIYSAGRVKSLTRPRNAGTGAE